MLHNSIKHSKASVELRNKKHMLLLSVSDNGIGFDYKKKLAEPG
jgi:signal transduction histidine kinase